MCRQHAGCDLTQRCEFVTRLYDSYDKGGVLLVVAVVTELPMVDGQLWRRGHWWSKAVRRCYCNGRRGSAIRMFIGGVANWHQAIRCVDVRHHGDAWMER